MEAASSIASSTCSESEFSNDGDLGMATKGANRTAASRHVSKHGSILSACRTRNCRMQESVGSSPQNTRNPCQSFLRGLLTMMTAVPGMIGPLRVEQMGCKQVIAMP